MLDAVTRIKTAINDGYHVCAVSLDIRGAFDNAWWPNLLRQLAKLGCPLNIFNVFKDYLSDRMVEMESTPEQIILKALIKGASRDLLAARFCGTLSWTNFCR